ncbi:MAG: hypothetical protein JNJ40_18530 [Bacteroidia bacterium]|nr:hypothetical protein [Bacteroidia bacterium]
MEPTNRAAITYYRTFQKVLEKIAEIDPTAKSAAYKSQLSQMELNLKNIKKIEPDFDVSVMVAEVEKYKNTITNQDGTKALDKDLAALNISLNGLSKYLNETKLNTDNIDLTMEGSTKPILRDIAIFKKNHPKHNITELENKVKDFENSLRIKLNGASSDHKNAKEQLKELEETIYLPYLTWRDYEHEDFIYGSHNPNGDPYLPDYIWSQNGINKLQSILNSYPLRAEKYLAKYGPHKLETSNSAGRKQSANSVSEYKSSAETSFLINFIKNNSLKDARMRLAEVEEKMDFVVDFYFERMVNAYRIINASKLTDNAELNAVAKIHQSMVDKLGDMDNYRNLVLENTIKNAKKVFMPKAKIENAEMEQLAKIALESRGWNETVLKVNLLDFDWRLERNTDFITGRVFAASIATKKENGLCMLYTATIRQEQIGERFAQPILYSYTSKYIAEENI